MKYHIGALAFFLMSVATATQAIEKLGIRLGDAELQPSVEWYYFDESNVYAQQSDETASTGMQIKPQIEFRADKRGNNITFGYMGDYIRYNDVDNIDSTAHILSAVSNLEFSTRSRLRIEGEYGNKVVKAGEWRGFDVDETTDGLLEYDVVSFDALYHYGGKTARGGLEFGLRYIDTEFTNFLDEFEQDSSVRVIPSFTFLYRVSPDTRLTAGLEYTDINNTEVDGIVSLDRKQIFSYLGAVWEITGKTGGSIKLGYGNRNFNDSLRDDYTSLLMELGSFWFPVSYSRFSLDVSRRFIVESANPSIRNRIAMHWSHNWSSRLFHNAKLAYIDDESEADADDRNQTVFDFNLGVSVYRWLDFKAGVDVTNTNADQPEDEFDRQRVYVGIEASL